MRLMNLFNKINKTYTMFHSLKFQCVIHHMKHLSILEKDKRFAEK